MSIISCFVLIAFQACLAILLTRRLGTGAGLLLHISIMLVLSGLGWFLLTQLTTEAITWRNRAVAILMPWPSIVGGGSLLGYVMKNTIASIVFAMVVVAIDRYQVLGMQTGTHNSRVPSTGPWLIAATTFICWLAIGIGWLWLLQSTLANWTDTAHPGLNLRSVAILVLPPILVVTSIALRYNGYSIASMLAVGVPLLVVLLPLLLMMAVVLFHYVTGKPMRWN